jgi:hypothetical protein
LSRSGPPDPEEEEIARSFRWICQHPTAGERDHPAYSPEGADHWGPRSCGVACVAMAGHCLGSSMPALPELLAEGRGSGAYIAGVGWTHAGLARLCLRHGMSARPAELTVDDLVGWVKHGSTPRLFIASVAREWRATQNGGHLVLVRGYEEADRGFEIADPGRDRRNLTFVDRHRFERCYAGRGVALSHE